MHPAILDILVIGSLIFIVAGEHARRPGNDFANSVFIGIDDFDFGIIKGNTNRIKINVTGLMNGIGAAQLGLTIKLAQRNAHRVEELKGFRPNRRTTGGG